MIIKLDNIINFLYDICYLIKKNILENYCIIIVRLRVCARTVCTHADIYSCIFDHMQIFYNSEFYLAISNSKFLSACVISMSFKPYCLLSILIVSPLSITNPLYKGMLALCTSKLGLMMIDQPSLYADCALRS